MSKRLIVTGGRWFNLTGVVADILGPLHGSHGISVLYHGGATGSDELCKIWASANGIDTVEREPNWKMFGNRAGNIRNSSMLRECKPDLAVAFPGYDGTKDMREKLLAAGVPTITGIYTAGSDEKGVSWSMVNG